MNEIILKKLVAALTSLLVILNGGSATHTNGVYKLNLPSKNFGSITTTAGFNFPTSSYSFNDGDIINAGDFNNILNWIGTKNSTDTASISYNAFNPPLSTASGTLSIAHGGTATTSFANTQGLVVASGTSALTSLVTNGNGSIPMASGTTWVANTITGGNNITITNTAGNISIAAGGKFGGTGADGALNYSSGSSTISLAGAPVTIKNYSSISIIGTSSIIFSNPALGGSIVIWKSQGACTLTSATTTMIDLRNTGGSGGGISNGGASGTGSGGGGGGGGGGGNGNNGGAGTGGGTSAPFPGASAFGNWMIGQVTAGGNGGSTTGGAGGLSPFFATSSINYFRALVVPGGGGGGGSAGTGGLGTAGAMGGGALYIECGGGLNFTGTINASGSTAANTGTNAGGGGGGGSGSVEILYNSLISSAGIIITNAGGGGASSGGGGGGAGGAGYGIVMQNTEF